MSTRARLTTALLLMLLAVNVRASCLGGEGSVLHARYDVYGQTQRYSVDFFRDDQRVAWRQGAVINVWSGETRTPSLLRAFPQYQRSIWYPAADLEALNRGADWQSVAGWPAPASLGYALKDGEAGVVQGCTVSEYVRGDSRVQWVEAAGVPARIAEGETVWQLVELDSVPAEETFLRWARWPSTDFADVGDSEADPFLRRMIAQGFIGRGTHEAASGEAAH
ncbi:hypothetical protein MWU49_07455 [Alcanivorax sp. S6407]|uniref:hypothetical protein n=1 Tax=Alcanivorax sp. S6407 TaxID=2926424 RepID=UPI001FF1975E|nr:hypothetical protein [Alcanivorax sp. S6407]MCK0153532.1 hypothetical protein [Alcanivorax sp. S6407]